ncbi:MAG: phosphatidylglycerophosphatase A [Gammaproteobacteria bacterium]|nr:phosphatidylglycerophosphatase A [Gammaproteobacteria bacterium]
MEIASFQRQFPKGFVRDPVHFLALGFGAGCMSAAPGTFGTLVGVALYLPLKFLYWPWYLAIVVALFALGVWLCGRTAKDLGEGDPSCIVWDEIVGFLITLLGAPLGWMWVVLGFLLFRVFDVVKPWPIRWIDQKVRGGLGIMLDDVVAGLYGLAILQIIVYLL